MYFLCFWWAFFSYSSPFLWKEYVVCTYLVKLRIFPCHGVLQRKWFAWGWMNKSVRNSVVIESSKNVVCVCYLVHSIISQYDLLTWLIGDFFGSIVNCFFLYGGGGNKNLNWKLLPKVKLTSKVFLNIPPTDGQSFLLNILLPGQPAGYCCLIWDFKFKWKCQLPKWVKIGKKS